MDSKAFYRSLKCGGCGAKPVGNPYIENEKFCQHGLISALTHWVCKCKYSNPRTTHKIPCKACDDVINAKEELRGCSGYCGVTKSGSSYVVKSVNDDMCFESYPCQHYVEILLTRLDGTSTSVTELWESPSIYRMLKTHPSPHNLTSCPDHYGP